MAGFPGVSWSLPAQYELAPLFLHLLYCPFRVKFGFLCAMYLTYLVSFRYSCMAVISFRLIFSNPFTGSDLSFERVFSGCPKAENVYTILIWISSYSLISV